MGGSGSGIGVLRARDDNGGAEFAGRVIETSSPSFLARKSDVLYAVDEGGSHVSAFRATQNSLILLGSQGSSGNLPCHLTAHDDWLFVSNYGSGSIDLFPIGPRGELGPLAQTLHGSGSGPHEAQDGPHAHSTLVVGDTVLSTDLGTDQVHVHRWSGGVLERTSSIALPNGTGPRDLALVRERVLVLGELSQEVFELADGAVVASTPVVQKRVPTDRAAALVPDARGRFAYIALRGSNRIAVIDVRTLAPVFDIGCGGDWPRHLAISGDTLYVANERSNTVTSFVIDAENGIISPIGEPEEVPSPTFLLAARPLDFVQRESLVK